MHTHIKVSDRHGPGDGKTARVHFNAGPDTIVRIMLGEVGEWGPLHPFVMSGHGSLAATTLLPRLVS